MGVAFGFSAAGDLGDMPGQYPVRVNLTTASGWPQLWSASRMIW